MLWSFDRNSMSRRKRSENKQRNSRWDQNSFFFKEKNWLIKNTKRFVIKNLKIRFNHSLTQISSTRREQFSSSRFLFSENSSQISLIFIFIYIIKEIIRIRIRIRFVIRIQFVIVETFMFVVFFEIKRWFFKLHVHERERNQFILNNY